MNKKNFLLVFILLFFTISCNAKELKEYGNPKIGKIVQLSKVQLLTEYKDDMVYPKYEIELKTKENYRIIALQLKTNYLFGQDLNLISSKDIFLNSQELEILNNEKRCTITVELEPIKKEKIKYEASEGNINEERISNGFIYLKYK